MIDHLLDRIPIPDYQETKKNFLEELIRASEGKPSSLSFVTHTLSDTALFTHGIMQGIVIGGTNFNLVTEKVSKNGKRKILEQRTGTLPIFDTKQTFVKFLLDSLDPRADAIGVNFGFKMHPAASEDGSLDGIIEAKGTKDHLFTGLTETVGTVIRTIFAEKYHKKIVVSVANDTITLLLAGNHKEQVSLVNGTGLNIGLRINKNTLVNLEAGGFNKFYVSEVLKEVDLQTKNPGKKLLEKMTSGMYVAKNFNSYAKHFGIMIPPVLSGQELTAIAYSHTDKQAQDLARRVIEQSASLVATALAAIYEFFDKPERLTVIGEGGLLQNGWHYNDNIHKQLASFELSGHAVTIKYIEDSAIKGAIGLLL